MFGSSTIIFLPEHGGTSEVAFAVFAFESLSLMIANLFLGYGFRGSVTTLANLRSSETRNRAVPMLPVPMRAPCH
ncbi:hypothetical protein Hypma_011242 [Hypsizygus marmoreus]|uniref:Uncharacterized protein n=1 Tax=Hypsizygus marmoreus TaxID=39966 RepID=A0A369JHC1_HYPMA|nr:hypothetical protein Hypma_011242 [Hypsizygus marmoreus]